MMIDKREIAAENYASEFIEDIKLAEKLKEIYKAGFCKGAEKGSTTLWIPVSVSLPPDGITVQVLINGWREGGPYFYVGAGKHIGDEVWIVNGVRTISGVIAWASLEEPPAKDVCMKIRRINWRNDEF